MVSEIIIKILKKLNFYIEKFIEYFVDYETVIFDIFNKNITIEKSETDSKLLSLQGVYYCSEKKYDLMKIYLDIAIEKQYTYAMSCLGNYYMNVEKNYDEKISPYGNRKRAFLFYV